MSNDNRNLERQACPKYPSWGEFKGFYNVEINASEAVTTHWTDGCPPPLTSDEFAEVHRKLRACLELFGPVNLYKDAPRDQYWLLEDNLHGDRTLALCLEGQTGLSTTCIQAVQRILRDYPLWRVQVDADSPEEVITIYPATVRVEREQEGDSIHEAIARITATRRTRRTGVDHRGSVLVWITEDDAFVALSWVYHIIRTVVLRHVSGAGCLDWARLLEPSTEDPPAVHLEHASLQDLTSFLHTLKKSSSELETKSAEFPPSPEACKRVLEGFDELIASVRKHRGIQESESE